MSDIPAPVARWLESVDLLSFVLWCGAIIALAGFAIRTVVKLYPAVKKLVKLSESLEKLPDWMNSTDKSLAEIRHEVLPNNGGSLRDDVVTISLQVQQMKAHNDKDYDRLGALEDTVNRRLELRDQANSKENQ